MPTLAIDTILARAGPVPLDVCISDAPVDPDEYDSEDSERHDNFGHGDADLEVDNGNDMDHLDGTRPRSIPFHWRIRRIQKFFARMLAELPRMRSLKIAQNEALRGSKMVNADDVVLGSRSAPHLVFVELLIGSSTFHEISALLASCDLPVLATLRGTGSLPTLLKMTSLFCSTMTTLSLTAPAIRAKEARTQEVKQLLDGLKQLTALERLEMVDIGPRTAPRNFRLEVKLNFPHLKALRLRDTAASLLRWLDRIELHPNMAVDVGSLRFPRISEDPDDLRRLANKLCTIVKAMIDQTSVSDSDAPLCAAFELVDIERYYSLHLWSRSSEFPDISLLPALRHRDRREGFPMLQGHIYMDIPWTVASGKIVDLVWRHLPLERIHAVQIEAIPTHLVFQSSRCKVLPVLLSCLQYMQAVETLSLWRWNAFWIKELLLPNGVTVEQGNLDFEKQPLLPALRKLVLEEMPLGIAIFSQHSRASIDKEDQVELKRWRDIMVAFRVAGPGAEILREALGEWQDEHGVLDEVQLIRCFGLSKKHLKMARQRLQPAVIKVCS